MFEGFQKHPDTKQFQKHSSHVGPEHAKSEPLERSGLVAVICCLEGDVILLFKNLLSKIEINQFSIWMHKMERDPEFVALNTNLDWLREICSELEKGKEVPDLVHSTIQVSNGNLLNPELSSQEPPTGKIPCYLETIVKKAEKLLLDHGYNIVAITPLNLEKFTFTEYHLYSNLTKPAFTLHSRFNEHCDSGGACSYDVHTAIFYLENSFPYGGELSVDSKLYGKKILLHPNLYNTILLNGYTDHFIRSMNGLGLRKCVVVQICTASNAVLIEENEAKDRADEEAAIAFLADEANERDVSNIPDRDIEKTIQTLTIDENVKT